MQPDEVPPLQETVESSPLHDMQLLELKFRVRHLQAPWWQRPAITAPLATIVVALLGLAWGMANGFFDIRRRELAVEKREREFEISESNERRDRRSLANRKSLTRQSKAIAELETRKFQLRNRIDQLNRPVLFEAKVKLLNRTSSRQQTALAYIRQVQVDLNGVNLGHTRGRVVVDLIPECPNERRRPDIAATIVAWSDSNVTIRLEPTTSLRVPRYCRLTFVIWLVRRDFKLSNDTTVHLSSLS